MNIAMIHKIMEKHELQPLPKKEKISPIPFSPQPNKPPITYTIAISAIMPIIPSTSIK